MTQTQQSILLHASRDDIGAKISGAPTGPVPTISVNAGHHINVEVDPTDLSSPVGIDIWDLEAADTDLRDLLGSAAVDQIWSLSISEPTGGSLDFTPTRAWEGLAALAFQLWNDRWNVFALDPSLTAVDKLAAASSAGPFGAQMARESLHAATPALVELKARQDQGQLASLAATIVDQAITGARKALPSTTVTLPPLEDTDVSLTMLLESRIESHQPGALEAGTLYLSSKGGLVERIKETADWRLTGLGMASTAEGMLQAEYVGKSRDIVRMSISVQEPIPTQNRSDEPYYQGIITDLANGEVLAFVNMALNAEGTEFVGTGPLSRPLMDTDVIDIRHPLVNEPVQRDLGLRYIDKVRRTAARAYAVERLAATTGEPVAEAVDVMEKAWNLVAKEASALQRIYPQFGDATKGWINVAMAHKRRALAASPNHSHRQLALKIQERQLPDMAGRKQYPATLAELGFTGHLYRPDQKELS